ncbi:MAG: three-Cys-motif partner protein TcmP [Bacillales bacterium]|nr:three-Cys-motif partner protein TcmP [Bacillales bacterium]
MPRQFFSSLQKHSEAKLRILEGYVIPWMRKIVLGPKLTKGKCLVIDGFAGTGKYSEGAQDGSPLILLKSAISFYEQAERHGWDEPNIWLLFIEGEKDNYMKLIHNIKDLTGLNYVNNNNSLNFESIPNYSSIHVALVNDTFENALSSLLNSLDSDETLIPSFCFVDPFGFKDTPLELISKYLNNDKAEILLNFIYEETNRFINYQNPKIQAHLSRLFGVDDLTELQNLIKDKSGAIRKEVIVDYYSRQLKEHTSVKHVLNFEIKKNGRTKLILFYGTKSPHGLKVMKKIMWKVDDTGFYMFDDRNTINQIQFDFIKEMQETELREKLATLIANQFSGATVDIEEVEEYVLTKTIYPIENFMKPALKILEKQNLIQITTPRSKNYSYPAGTKIKFI